jgi:sortase A
VGKESRLKGKRRTPLYLLTALLLALGGLALWAGVIVAAGAEPVRDVASPAVAPAPEPIDEAVAERIAREERAAREAAERKAAKEKAAEERAEEKRAEEKRAEEKRAEEKRAEEKRAEEKRAAAEEQQVAAPVETEPAVPVAVDAPAPSSTQMYLTVPKMGIQNDPVGEGLDEATLYNGAGHEPSSGYPWIPGSNVYIASHVLGYEGTGSYMHFANLPSMTYGDEIFITDANGTNYTYQVSEVLQVSIHDTWVMEPTGKDQISLQTCINPPAYDVRLVVRGDLVSVS